MIQEKMPTTIEKYLGQRLGIKRVIDNVVSTLEAANEEDDIVDFETLIEKLEEKVTYLNNHQRENPFAHRRRQYT